MSKSEPEINISTVKISVDFELNWPVSSISFLISKSIFLQKLFALFLYYIEWERRALIFKETFAGD